MLACASLFLFLHACAQTPTPTVEAIEFSVLADPSAAPLLDELVSAYQAGRPFVKVNTDQAANTERALEAMRSGADDLALVSWLPNSAQIGQDVWMQAVARDSIVMVIHSANPVGDLTLAQLRAIFQGQVLNWTELGGPDVDLVPISREDGSGTRNSFESLVMGRREVSPTAVVMSSSEAVIEFVSETPGAIGYVPTAMLTPSVNIVAVEGTTPSPSAVERGWYFLARPFYLVAGTEPGDGLADFADWTTNGTGQQVIARYYASAP
jgi:phosphate transport system substrate-binding protein